MITHGKRYAPGFSLIELMVVVAIVSIISAIAYPSYRENIKRSNRAEVRALMLENAQFMERFFTENNSYLQTAGAATPPVLPNLVSPRGAVGTKVNYNIAFRAVPARTATTFAIQAVPVNGMAADACATLTYNHLGQRGTDGTLSGGMTSDTCWSK